MRLSGLEPETYGLKVRLDEIATTEPATTCENPAERLGVLLGAFPPEFTDLATVCKAWPTLSDDTRRAVLALVETTKPKPPPARRRAKRD